jgi:glyoxylase I family protein
MPYAFASPRGSRTGAWASDAAASGSIEREHPAQEIPRMPAKKPAKKSGAKPAPKTAAKTTAKGAKFSVRYQVADIDRSIGFYTEHLGFRPGERAGSAFASVSRGDLRLILSGPGSSGSRPLPDGRRQAPGGWNRIVLDVEDLPARVSKLEQAGVRFRNEIEVGPGGSQIQVEDPDGNPIELHEPPKPGAGR